MALNTQRGLCLGGPQSTGASQYGLRTSQQVDKPEYGLSACLLFYMNAFTTAKPVQIAEHLFSALLREQPWRPATLVNVILEGAALLGLQSRLLESA